MDTRKLGFDTKLVHAGDFEDANGSAVTPIYQTSTFAFKNADHGANLFIRNGSCNDCLYSFIKAGRPYD